MSNYLNPKYTSAQLVYLSLDTAFNLIEEKSGSLLATEKGILESLALENLEALRNGFLYIFVANETTAPIDFDNLIVIHKTGIVLETNDYYPFGMRWYNKNSFFKFHL